MEKVASHRVQKIGGGLSITIPAPWAKDLGVEKGTFLDLYREKDKLILMKKQM